MLAFFVKHKRTWSQELLAGVTSGSYLFLELLLFSSLINQDIIVLALILGVILILGSGFATAKGMLLGLSRTTLLFFVFYSSYYPTAHIPVIVILSGFLQFLIGQAKFGKFIRLVPRSVYLGFLNGVSVLLLLYIIKAYVEVDVLDYVVELIFLVSTVFAILWFPKYAKGFPVILAVMIAYFFLVMFQDQLPLVFYGKNNLSVPSIDMFWRSYNFNIIDFVELILPCSVLLAIMNLIESLMGVMFIEELTGQRASGNQESRLLGFSNMISGVLSCLPFVTSVTASTVNIKSGGKGRLSIFTAGFVLLVLGYLTYFEIFTFVPLVLLMAIQFTVFLGVFRWTGISYFDKIPLRDTVTVVLVSGLTILTELPTVVVLLGVIISALGFAWDSAVQIRVVSSIDKKGIKTYSVRGLLFFASFNHFLDKFAFDSDKNQVIVDFESARIVDHSGIEAIHVLIDYFRANDVSVVLKSLSRDSRFLLTKTPLGEGVFLEENANDPDYKIVTDRVIK